MVTELHIDLEVITCSGYDNRTYMHPPCLWRVLLGVHALIG